MSIINEKSEFLKNLEDNPKLLYNLSLDRLKILKKYYEEDIKIKEKKIKELKKQLQESD